MNRQYIIAELSDKTFNPSYSFQYTPDEYHVRLAARGILEQNGKIALLNVTNKHYHKLPGGGLENHETVEDAFKREILEETGYTCKILTKRPFLTIERKELKRQFQLSYIFFAKALTQERQVNYTQEELGEGFKLEWVDSNNILDLLKNDRPLDLLDTFVSTRDTAIIKFYLDSKNNPDWNSIGVWS